MTRSLPILLACTTGLALLAAPPAAAVTYTTYVQALSVHFNGTASHFTYLYSNGSAGPVTAAGSSSDGYAAAFASGDDGGTVSATAFARNDQTSASGYVTYSILLDAPTTVTSKARVSFAGLLTTWGSGTARAEIDLGLSTSFFYAGNSTGKAMTVPFRLSRTLTLTGGTPIPLGITGVASVNYSGISGGENHLGFASAYVDPHVTIGAVPEPATWTLLIAGFGMTGVAARRRARQQVTA